MPLLVGTLKGTLYSLFLAIPLGVLGAMYTSQFMHPCLQALRQADGGGHGRPAQRGPGLPGRPVAGSAGRGSPARLAAHAGRCCRSPPSSPACCHADAGRDSATAFLAGMERLTITRWRSPGIWVCLRLTRPVRAAPVRRQRSRSGCSRPPACVTISATRWWSAWPWASP